MNLLEQIISHKKKEVAERKKQWSIERLQEERLYSRIALSLKKFISNPSKLGVIAEFIRRSPTRGIINDKHSVEAVTKAYKAYGASAISITTDLKYYGGSLDDLVSARDNGLPILRRDFIIDEYQLVESKAFGADAVSLIASCLTREEVMHLIKRGKSLGMEVILEIENETELEYINDLVSMVCIRNDSAFDLDQTIQLGSQLPPGKLKIAGIDINGAGDVRLLKQGGYDGFLIGEYFMRQENPMMAFKEFSYTY